MLCNFSMSEAETVILSPVHIGDRASVGANAVCVVDTPAGRTAADVSARIIKRSTGSIGGEN